MTTVQISSDLQTELARRKLYKKETYEEVIWDLIEDSKELSEETQRNIKQAEKEIKKGKVHKWEDIKKELKIDVWSFLFRYSKKTI